MNRCPHCGRPIEIKLVKTGREPARSSGLFQSTVHTPFKSEAATVPVQRPSFTETPVFLPNRESHVLVPGAQALIYGVLATPVGALILGAVADGLGYKFGPVAFYGGVGTFFISTLAIWHSKVSQYDGLLIKLEEWTGLDLNRDGETGKPEPEKPLRIEFRTDNRTQFADLPNAGELTNFARDIINNIRTFSERGASEGGYGVENFRQLRGVFLDRGWATWKNSHAKQQGVELTRGGLFILRQIAAQGAGTNEDDALSPAGGHQS